MFVRNRHDVAPVTYGDEARGVEMRPLITDREGAPTFSMRVFTLAADGHTPFHSHEWEHEVYILAGDGVLRTADGERAVHPGDSVFIAPHEFHQFCGGPAGLQFICCAPHH